MVLIDEEDFLTRNPNTNLEIFAQMDNELKDTYLAMYMKYSELFNKFIALKVGLKEYDTQVENSSLAFLPLKEQEMDLYQYLSHDDLNYFYIRNNYYIERLDGPEKEYLIKKVLKSDSNLDDEAIEFIKKTYKKLIYEKIDSNNEIYNINFGPISNQYFAPNNALVIGFRYDEFNNQDMSDQEWDDNHNKQMDFYTEIFSMIENKLSEELNMTVVVLKYDEFSVKKKPVTEKNNLL